MVQKKDLKTVSWMEQASTGTVCTAAGRVPAGRRRYIYFLKYSSVGATDAAVELDQRFSATATSDWQRDYTYVNANEVPQIPTNMNIDKAPAIVFDEETYLLFKASGAAVGVTMTFADE